MEQPATLGPNIHSIGIPDEQGRFVLDLCGFLSIHQQALSSFI